MSQSEDCDFMGSEKQNAPENQDTLFCFENFSHRANGGTKSERLSTSSALVEPGRTFFELDTLDVAKT